MRSGPALVCACAALAAVLGGCTAAPSSSSVTVSGTTLTIYASAPASISDPAAQDILSAERLALQKLGTTSGKYTIKFVQLTGKPADNARAAISDTTAIAYLGEPGQGVSADSIGITNAQDVLQVSPADTAVELTQATAAAPGAPNIYYESLSTYGRTFARVVPNSAVEAKAQAGGMQTLGVAKLFVSDDGTPYGKAAALAVRAEAATKGITIAAAPSSADAEFFGSANPGAAAHAFTAAIAANPSMKLFGPSGLDTQAFASSLTGTFNNLYISAPGFLAKDLPPAATQFVSEFTSAYGHAPAQSAIFGYEAMAAVLAAIRQAGASANDRSMVVRAFFSLKRSSLDSVLGSYSVSSTTGDTSLTAFVLDRFRAGRLVPFVAVPG